MKVDGVELVEGDALLFFKPGPWYARLWARVRRRPVPKANTKENGIYVVRAGMWERP